MYPARTFLRGWWVSSWGVKTPSPIPERVWGHIIRVGNLCTVSITVSLSSLLWIWRRPLVGWRLRTFLVQLRDWWWLLKTKLLRLGTMSTTSCIGMSVPLAACAMQAWRQSTTLWQAVVHYCTNGLHWLTQPGRLHHVLEHLSVFSGSSGKEVVPASTW